MVVDRLSSGFQRIIDLKGVPVEIKYFTGVAGSVYDDDLALTQSGNSLNISGIVFPLKTREGSEDSVLLAQGKLQNQDKVLYLNGSIATTGVSDTVQFIIGSTTYSTIPDGAKVQMIGNEAIYKKQYIRYLPLNLFLKSVILRI